MIVFLSIILWIAFFLSALLLIITILLQEPKGGGLAEAFGGMGAQTFGVKSGGINRFTFTVFAVFIFSALMIHALRDAGHSSPSGPGPSDTGSQGVPQGPGGGGAPSPTGGTGKPAGGTGK